MKKILLIALLVIPTILFAQGTPRAGGINNAQAGVLTTVNDNYVGIQTTNSNAFAVYNFTNTFNYHFGLQTTDNLTEGSTNKFFSNTLARNAFSAGTGLSYSSGVFELDSGTQSTLATVSGKQAIITLTTTGSGVSTFIGNTLNIPTPPTLTINIPTNIASGTRSFGTAYRESATDAYNISLGVQLSCNLSLSGGQSGYVELEISANGTTGWSVIGGQRVSGSNIGSLTIGLNTTQITGAPLEYDIPLGYYYRMISTNVTGTPTYSFIGGSYRIL